MRGTFHHVGTCTSRAKNVNLSTANVCRHSVSIAHSVNMAPHFHLVILIRLLPHKRSRLALTVTRSMSRGTRINHAPAGVARVARHVTTLCLLLLSFWDVTLHLTITYEYVRPNKVTNYFILKKQFSVVSHDLIMI